MLLLLWSVAGCRLGRMQHTPSSATRNNMQSGCIQCTAACNAAGLLLFAHLPNNNSAACTPTPLQIIALANLRHKATHSTQTLLSHFRQEGSSQTWLPKQAAVQTRVNAGSSVPRKLRHVTGLRGPPDTKMKAVALELDVHGKGRATVKSQGGQRPL